MVNTQGKSACRDSVLGYQKMSRMHCRYTDPLGNLNLRRTSYVTSLPKLKKVKKNTESEKMIWLRVTEGVRVTRGTRVSFSLREQG